MYVGPDRTPYQVEGVASGKRSRLKLAGVDSRQAGEALRGAQVSVPLREAVPLPDGCYYGCQVIGAEVVTTAGERLGAVSEILQTGSNDVYVAPTPDGELLIPAIPDVVRRFDVEAKVLHVELLPGLR